VQLLLSTKLAPDTAWHVDTIVFAHCKPLPELSDNPPNCGCVRAQQSRSTHQSAHLLGIRAFSAQTPSAWRCLSTILVRRVSQRQDPQVEGRDGEKLSL
jgi:hypothetical protein